MTDEFDIHTAARALGAEGVPLSDALAARGYRHEPAATLRSGARAIYRADAPDGSAPVYVGTCFDVWPWLARTEGAA